MKSKLVRLTLLLALCTFAEREIKAAAGDQKLDPQVAGFLAVKRAQVEAISKISGRPTPNLIQDFFAAAARADFQAATNAGIRAMSGPESDASKSELKAWSVLRQYHQPVTEALGILELFQDINPKFLRFLGQEVTKSIPPGSIYFGGSDEGYLLVLLFSKSQVEGRPFFTITQNQLADGSYLDYLADIYGKTIRIANTNDAQRCFQEYVSDAQRRLEHDSKFPDKATQLKPGENVKMIDGRLMVSGEVAVMGINGLLAKVIFDKNPGHEFYTEESHPIEWMYPHLTPHQFIFKINREPLVEISPDTMLADRDFWTRHTDAWLGPWLRTNTSLSEIMDFADRIYVRNEMKSFKGDPEFVKNHETQKAFGRMRAAIAGAYAWRAANAKKENDRQRMAAEADYAFRQAVAIAPASPDAVSRFAELLANNGRLAEALRLVKSAVALDRSEDKFKTLLQTFRESEGRGVYP